MTIYYDLKAGRIEITGPSFELPVMIERFQSEIGDAREINSTRSTSQPSLHDLTIQGSQFSVVPRESTEVFDENKPRCVEFELPQEGPADVELDNDEPWLDPLAEEDNEATALLDRPLSYPDNPIYQVCLGLTFLKGSKSIDKLFQEIGLYGQWTQQFGWSHTFESNLGVSVEYNASENTAVFKGPYYQAAAIKRLFNEVALEDLYATRSPRGIVRPDFKNWLEENAPITVKDKNDLLAALQSAAKDAHYGRYELRREKDRSRWRTYIIGPRSCTYFTSRPRCELISKIA
jgi:hypothetical protein